MNQETTPGGILPESQKNSPPQWREKARRLLMKFLHLGRQNDLHPTDSISVDQSYSKIQQIIDNLHTNPVFGTELVPLEEKKEEVSGLGKQYQSDVSEMYGDQLPKKLRLAGASGLLGTNESLPEEVIKQVRESGQPPDGYIVGVAFGSIMSMLRLFPEGREPLAILSHEVVDELVIGERIAVALMAKEPTFDDFFRSIRDENEILTTLAEVIEGEKNPQLQERFRQISFQEVKKNLEIVSRDQSYMMISPDKLEITEFGHTVTIIMAVVRRYYSTLHNLAVNNNIGIALADLTDPRLFSIIEGMPKITEKSNVFYESNIVDHISDRGTNVARGQEKMSKLSAFNTISGKIKNWFVDTTQVGEYILRANNAQPSFSEADLVRPPIYYSSTQS